MGHRFRSRRALWGFVLANGPQMLQAKPRIIPDQVRETVASFKSWLDEDSEWTGSWSASPEAYADISDMQLSNIDMQLTIWPRKEISTAQLQLLRSAMLSLSIATCYLEEKFLETQLR
ncbi:hypothetical protein [Pseudoxanthomonas mexicana]